MTVSETDNKQRTTGNGVTVAFPATIKIFAETDITVKTIVIATDVKANDLILNDGGALGFTVVFDTEDETLTVTVNTAPTSLEDIQILRVLPITQTTDFPVATKFPAVSSENAHDKNTMILQDQQEQLDRAFVLPEESSATSPSLPNPSSRRALIWDPAEDGTIINSAKDPDAAQTDAAASATAASSSEGNAATSATNAATSATNAATSETNAAASANSQIRFAFADSTDMDDPGAGNFRMNNATPSSVTAIAFDATMNQTGNPDISDYLATWDDSTNTVTGQLTLIKNGEPETFALFNVTAVTDNTGWLQITVTHVASNGTFSASDNIDTFFSRSGDSAAGFSASDITGQTEAVVAAADNFVYTQGGVLKRDTIQGILDLGGGAMKLLSTATASASASIDFTSGIDATFEEYIISIANMVPATDGAVPKLLYSNDTGSTFEVTAYKAIVSLADLVGNTVFDPGATRIALTDTDGVDAGDGTSGWSGNIHIFNPAASGNRTQCHFQGFYKSDDGGVRLTACYGGGARATEANDAFRIIMDSGNIASGKFKLYGVKKS